MQLRRQKLVFGDSTFVFLLPSRYPGELWPVGHLKCSHVNLTGYGIIPHVTVHIKSNPTGFASNALGASGNIQYLF